ncbi:hypothetical protein CHL72_11560, partial [Streptococcus pneumoniae]
VNQKTSSPILKKTEQKSSFNAISNKKKRLHQPCSLFAVLKMKRQILYLYYLKVKNPPLSKD